MFKPKHVCFPPSETEHARFLKDLRVEKIGCLSRKEAFSRNFVFDTWAMMYVVGGRGTFRAGNGPTLTVGPGSFFTGWPGPVFNYGPPAGETWEEYFITLTGPRVKRWIAQGIFPQSPAIFRAGVLAEQVEEFHHILNICTRAPPARTMRLRFALNKSWCDSPTPVGERLCASPSPTPPSRRSCG